jgi:hypothetical protein
MARGRQVRQTFATFTETEVTIDNQDGQPAAVV